MLKKSTKECFYNSDYINNSYSQYIHAKSLGKFECCYFEYNLNDNFDFVYLKCTNM